MAKTSAEQQKERRESRRERYREQLASGGLVVRQMTVRERAYWDEHSAAAERLATSEGRKRRDAAREKLRRRQAVERSAA